MYDDGSRVSRVAFGEGKEGGPNKAEVKHPPFTVFPRGSESSNSRSRTPQAPTLEQFSYMGSQANLSTGTQQVSRNPNRPRRAFPFFPVMVRRRPPALDHRSCGDQYYLLYQSDQPGGGLVGEKKVPTKRRRRRHPDPGGG